MLLTIFRLTASSASSCGAQASMGRPESAAGVQARATIWTIYSAVKVSGAPGRGASASTVKLLGDDLVGLAGGGGADNLDATGECLRAGVLPQQPFQHDLLRWCHGNDLWLRTSHSGSNLVTDE